MDAGALVGQLIVGAPAIIAAVATIMNGRRLKRVSERTKLIHAATAHGKNGAPEVIIRPAKKKRAAKKAGIVGEQLPGTYSPQSHL